MPYSVEAQQARQCTATTRLGKPCVAYAVWGSDTCYSHGGKATGAPLLCHCPYAPFAHRPGGGGCNWPSQEPSYRLDLPIAGLHGERRNLRRSAQRRGLSKHPSDRPGLWGSGPGVW